MGSCKMNCITCNGRIQTPKFSVEKDSNCNAPQEGTLVLLNINDAAGTGSTIQDRMWISATSQLLSPLQSLNIRSGRFSLVAFVGFEKSNEGFFRHIASYFHSKE